MRNALQELLVIYTTPVYVLLILGEVMFSRAHDLKWYTWKDTITNIYLMVLNSAIELITRSAIFFLILYYFYQYSFISIDNAWVYWVALLFAEDLCFYWLHWLEHHSRFFWAIHVTHHSSEQFNLTVGFRSSVFEPIIRGFFFIPLVLFGFRPVDIVVMYSATQIFGILVHTKAIGKMGWLEYIFATPSNHRVHHASNVRYLDKNMGMVFIFWDKLFGTYEREDEHYQSIRYGLTKKLDDEGPVNIIIHEWKAIWKDIHRNVPFATKLKYIFNAPGWSHDGSSKTSDQLREEEAQVNRRVLIPGDDAGVINPLTTANNHTTA